METVYSAREVARIFGLDESRVRYWAQTGFINPGAERGGRRYYTFQDLIAVRAAKTLLEAGVSVQRQRKLVAALRAQLPHVDRPLGRLRIWSDGDRVVVQADDAAFEPESGQLTLDFDTATLGRQVASVLDLGRAARTDGAGRAPAGATALALFVEGCAAEEDPESLERARLAYRRAVELDPQMAAAWTNLGNLCLRAGDREQARDHYARALAADPDQPEAHYNVARLHEDAGDTDGALDAYRRAVALDPRFADAHFNLALALERVGHALAARSHFERCLELWPGTEDAWARAAREHLERLAGERRDDNHA